MGNTTRRQPITHSIPAAPNYKFLNITDFRGLNVTDNPFTAQPNTASDCLNVYVDENNALSTRPRLEKRINFATNGYSVVNVYPINSGYLVHRKKDGVYSLWIAEYDNLSQLIPVENDDVVGKIDKLTVFEQNRIICILDGSNMTTISKIDDKYVSSYIDPYIPTLYGGLGSEGGVDKTKIEQLEPLNIWTTKYKETYFWDGVSKLVLDNPEKEVVENKYFIDKYLNVEDIVKNKSFLEYNKDTNEYISRDNRSSININSAFSDIQSYTIYHHVEKNTELETSKLQCRYNNAFVDVVIPKGYCYGVCKNMTLLVMYDNDAQKLYVYKKPDVTSNYYLLYNASVSMSEYCERIECHTDNTFVLYSHNNAKSVYSISYNSDFTIRLAETSSMSKIEQIEAHPSGLLNLIIERTSSSRVIYFTSDNIKDIYYEKLSNCPRVTTTVFGGDLWDERFVVSFADDKCSISLGENIVIIENITTSEPKILHEMTIPYVDSITLATSGHYGYGIHSAEIDNDFEYRFVIFPDIINRPNEYYNTYFYHYPYGRVYYDTDSILISFAPDVNGVAKECWYPSIMKKYYDNHAPSVITTNTLSELNKEMCDELSKNKTELQQAKLYTRFDNKMWLAHKNKLFYSKYDNLNYFPITQYDIIGDDTDVTSFNLASDSLLIVYKNNAICTVYPTTVNNEYTYVFADSKNTVGNDAIGNSIVSVLTERPLQITTKGIYALKQVENIESNSRISELISEPINKKWLQESDYVPQCITMNRLYWTYFILPYEKYTKVYLLDNRTSSWYYWELPVVTINAFVKDDKSMIVSSNGKLYSLETTDTISPHNPDTTKYYDDDRKLIKWYWTSQILPLGTINYSKRLVDTTFIVADTDASDSYALNYKFKTYRKLASESNATTITNRLNYIQSTTKKTLIPRFNFIQIEISNVEEDAAEALDNNKIRLVGLGLKYILLEALI